MSGTLQQSIRLLLVDDHALFLGGLSHLLSAQPDFEVAGCASNIPDAIEKFRELKPDVVLLDVDLGNGRAIDFLRSRSADNSTCPVLVVTAGVSEFEAIQLVHAGARGVFHKHNPPEELCDAVRRVRNGDVVLQPQYLKALFAAIDPKTVDPRPTLSEREVALLRYLLQGLGNKEIAAELNISESSVKGILRGMFDRLGVRSRSQIVKVALNEYRDLL
jgi:DNA-binding NarL/FixJ family response regulator